ncbi:hypothetical protein GKQ77_01665 [Streptomyces sp. BG9H]|uniref:Uncharacterized protein n=1 Tax=Streptomyces anatolicus TaxID=2675858 RepID=A0ABS6YFW2_9ACTN|nr:hypothetical protein [Streptomyces anatolicus]MBW5420278.1 hypothetical protein [Streptomyces anatolicus]
MSQITFSLSRYDGPAVIGGIRFAQASLREQADQEGDGVIKSWEGTASVARSEASEVTPEWLERPGPVKVGLPEGGTGTAHITGAALIDDRLWELDLVGAGPSPMANAQR